MLRFVLRGFARHVLAQEWQGIRSQIDRLAASGGAQPPLIAQQLLVSGEDHRHGHHPGYDLIAILRAIWKRLLGKSREGGSTIEQQLVRVLTGHFERTIRRKLKEIGLAALVAENYPKHLLPRMYLRIAYYGAHMNGYAQACRRLKLDPVSLSLEDAAMVVARLKYPQPHALPDSRRRQIQIRARHLISLRIHHLRDATYECLTTTARATTLSHAHLDEAASGLLPDPITGP
ncbi:MAG TPA: biosynthetic peptidoglycan transglycosylase [Gemmatimonadales bacterium]